jgi:hypothetical protein
MGNYGGFFVDGQDKAIIPSSVDRYSTLADGNSRFHFATISNVAFHA